MTILTTPEEAAAFFASAVGGESATLACDLPAGLRVSKPYSRQVRLRASGYRITGLDLRGSQNFYMFGGTVVAPGGTYGFATQGYAVWMVNTVNPVLSSVRFTGAHKGIVTSNVDGGTISGCTFEALAADGMILSQTRGMRIVNNRFRNFVPRLTKCNVGGTVTEGLSQRACLDLGGAWTDGDHPDGIQFRNGSHDLFIQGNTLEGDMQAIPQMDSPSDAPCDRVIIDRNTVRTTMAHTITLGRSTGSRITNNIIAPADGGKTLIRAPAGTFMCGNTITPLLVNSPGLLPCE